MMNFFRTILMGAGPQPKKYLLLVAIVYSVLLAFAWLIPNAPRIGYLYFLVIAFPPGMVFAMWKDGKARASEAAIGDAGADSDAAEKLDPEG